MFDNIGGKFKGFAMALFFIEAFGACIAGFALVEKSNGISLLLVLAGILVAWISSWFLYGFGEIICKLSEIEQNTHDDQRRIEAPLNRNETQTRDDYDRRQKIEKLRAKGLITEEEYQQALTKKQ